MVVPICFCQRSPSVQGTVARTSDRAWDRQAPQSFTPRTKLVRNPKITSPGWKMEKRLGFIWKCHPRLHLPLQSLEKRQEKEGQGYPFPSTNLFPCPRLPNEALCWSGNGKISLDRQSTAQGLSMELSLGSAPAKYTQNQGLSKFL